MDPASSTGAVKASGSPAAGCLPCGRRRQDSSATPSAGRARIPSWSRTRPMERTLARRRRRVDRGGAVFEIEADELPLLVAHGVLLDGRDAAGAIDLAQILAAIRERPRRRRCGTRRVA